MTARKKTNNHRKPTELRRSEIADVAMRIIAEQGTRRFTAKLIAKELGITDAAVFRHFATKQAIVEAIIERMETILFEGFPPQGDDPLRRLGLFFERRVRAISSHPHLSRLLLSDHLAHAAGPESLARITEFKGRSQQFVLSCLKEAKERGLLAEGVGAEELTLLVLGAILSLVHTGGTSRGKGAIEPVSRKVWALLERLMRGEKPTRVKITGNKSSITKGPSRRRAS
jgi:AcrR family transcriptional regulator